MGKSIVWSIFNGYVRWPEGQPLENGGYPLFSKTDPVICSADPNSIHLDGTFLRMAWTTTSTTVPWSTVKNCTYRTITKKTRTLPKDEVQQDYFTINWDISWLFRFFLLLLLLLLLCWLSHAVPRIFRGTNQTMVESWPQFPWESLGRSVVTTLEIFSLNVNLMLIFTSEDFVTRC